MKETQFIAQNKSKWQSFEKILQQEQIAPESLKDIYLQVTDDLSYARTFYPNRSVRVYLNGLSKKVYNEINAYKKSSRSRLFSFWTDELPRLVSESRPAFRLSFFVFVLAMLIGAFSSANDPEFVRTILGDGYVDMTLENIADGDPMRVYKESKEMGMSVGITLNNIFVAFLTFLMGIFYLIGSIGILISNGVMVGAFQYFFYEQGFLLESFLTIWMHGALEISSIVIAGAAGLTMGHGLVFPGTYSRAKAFQISAKRGLKIMIGITPIFVLAGFIEGFLTRHTELPNVFRALFILASFGFIIWYFVIYPIYKKKKGFKDREESYKLQADNLHQFSYYQVKTSGQLFNETFLFYARKVGIVGVLFVVLSIIFTLFNAMVMKVVLEETFIFKDNPLVKLGEIPQLFYNVNEKWLLPFSACLYTVVSLVVFFLFEREALESGDVDQVISGRMKIFAKAFGVIIINILVVGLLAFNNALSLLTIPFILPFLLLWAFSTYRGEIGFFSSFVEAWRMYFSNFSKILGLTFSFWAIGGFFYSFVQTGIFWFLVNMVAWNLDVSQKDLNSLVNMFLLFFSYFNMILIYTLNLIGFGFAYYALKEESEGKSLKEKIGKISFDNQIRGIAKEV